MIGNVVAVLVPDQGTRFGTLSLVDPDKSPAVGLKLRRDMLERVQKREP
ncbi:MAG: hypothetical protein M3505_13190 [Verrucomicrobiota bacterium]|nr:hypothetical protein [Verrucomicrobiota bacterium]